MRKFTFPTVSSLLRKVLILGVFAGLVFSCAEGIRLLPFPPPGDLNGADSFGSNSVSTGHLSYLKSFESSRGSISRTKPSPGTHIFSGSSSPAVQPFRALSAVLDVSPTFAVFFQKSVSGRRLPGSRGPPVSS